MIDANGFRLNVGIILANDKGEVFWGRRVGVRDAWQFPQGGLQSYESILEAMYRELTEELGLTADDVEVLAHTPRWHYYHLPKHLRRYNQKPLCVGQKQKWFLLRLTSSEDNIRFDMADRPEFTDWRWVDFWYPVEKVIDFKRKVYQDVLQQFEPVLFP